MFASKEFATAIVNRKLFADRAVVRTKELEASGGIISFEVDDGLRLVVLHTISKAATKATAAEGDVYRFEQVCLAGAVWSNDDGATWRQCRLIEAIGAKMI